MSRYGYSDTFSDLLKAAGKTNYFAIALAILLLVFIAIREFDLLSIDDASKYSSSLLAYMNSAIIYWVICYLLFLYSFLLPTYRIRHQPHGKNIVISVSFVFIITLIIILFLVPYRLEKSPEQYLTAIGIIIGAIVAVFGIFFQLQVSTFGRRSNNSMQALLQMRMSEVFQNHVETINEQYPNRLGCVIPTTDVALFLDVKQDDQDTSGSEKNKAISSQVYILNYFEFLSYGIHSAALDEELLYSTLGNIFIQNCNRGQHLIDASMNVSTKCYEYLNDLRDKWKLRHDYETQVLKSGKSK